MQAISSRAMTNELMMTSISKKSTASKFSTTVREIMTVLRRVNEHERDLDGLNGMNEVSKASTSKKSTASKSVYGENEFPMAPTSQ